MKIQGIVTTTVLTLAIIIISTTTAAALSCDCGNICVNETGWWRDGGAFNASTMPIQAAADNATAGETICVAAGNYTENVDITKQLTLVGVGEDVVTVMAASSSDYVFNVTADYVNISWFTVTGATGFNNAGIYLNGANHCNISKNNCSKNCHGICLVSSNNNTLASNTANLNHDISIHLVSSGNNTLANNTASLNNGIGIHLIYSSDNTITSNTANSNNNIGIHLISSSDNTLASNTANSNTGTGIHLISSSDNTLVNNNVSSNDNGICMDSSNNNTLVSNIATSNNDDGIHMDSSSDNTLANNTASLNEGSGIYLRFSSNYNTATNNTAGSNKAYGIYIEYSSDNTLANNTANSNNYGGIHLHHSSNNLVYNNYFNNTNNAYDNNNDNNNQWNITKTSGTNIIGGPFLGGNYWSDYAGADGNGDGLGDTLLPYNSSGDIQNGGDLHPLTTPSVTYTPSDPINLANTTGNYWVNYTWSAGAGNATDSYNVNMNGTWTNGTTDTFANATVSPSGWVNITVFAYNTSGTGTPSAGSVSDEVQAPAAPPATYIPPNPVNLRNMTGNYWVNYTWNVGTGGNATDSYNVNLNGTWTNGTTDTFANATVGPSGWANITVFAYNTSGTGTLSTGSISDEVQAPAAPDPICNCTCGDICVNQSGWWRDGGTLKANNITQIQAAVDNATAGETICVKAGNYNENVDITTAHLTLRGEGAGVVTVNAADLSDHVFEVTGTWVNISGFTVTGATGSSRAGICLEGADNCNISENNASNNYRGIYLWASSNTLLNNTADSNNDYGIYLEESSDNTLEGNTADSNNWVGICLGWSSNNNTLANNTAYSNYAYGIHLRRSSNYNVLMSNTASDNRYGIWLDSSSDNTLAYNTADSNNWAGILLQSSSNNTLLNNTADSNIHGISLSPSSNNTLTGNTVPNNNYGISLFSSSNNTLVSNSADSNNRYGILLQSSSDNTLASNSADDNYDIGIGLSFSSNYNMLTDNNASSNNRYGIWLDSSSGNTLVNNNCSNNEDGINMWFSSNNKLMGNTANSNKHYGISLEESSDNNTLASNTVSSNDNCGIRMKFSSNYNMLTGNNVSLNSGNGIYLYSSCNNNTLKGNTADSNIVNGIYLYSSCNNNTLTGNNASSNIGSGIYLYSSCNNNTLSGNTADSNIGSGIYLYTSCNNIFTGNNASLNGDYGIYLYTSSNYNKLTGNNASLNGDPGIYLYTSCNNNTLTGNNASLNDDHGIVLDSSCNNTLTCNTADLNSGNGIQLKYLSNYNKLTGNTANSNSDYGIYLYSSSNNTLACNTANSNLGSGGDGVQGCGIFLDSSSNNTLTSNNASNNEWDFYITGSDSSFTDNTLNGTTVSFTYGGDISLRGAGLPAADPAGQQTIGKFISATNQSAGAWLFLNFSYSDADVSSLAESDLKVWKHNGTMWLEDGWNGTRYLDISGNVVGVNITSFSVFAPAAPEIGSNYIPGDPTNLANTTGNYWVNYTWSAGTGGNITDSYNVCLNGTWDNGTTDTFMNTSVGPSGWANITVFAYNASGTGTFSEENVSDEVQAPSATDATPPVILITTPEPDGIYIVGMTLDFSATDDESGVDTIEGNLTNSSGVSQDVDSGFEPGVGVYTLVVTATDNASNTNESDPVFFVVYDPAAGRATGEGWFDPGSGSTLLKADFEFTAWYNNDVSTGSLDFEDKDAGIKLSSTSIDWLVISDVSAQFQGTGTINGEDLYTFRVQAKDLYNFREPVKDLNTFGKQPKDLNNFREEEEDNGKPGLDYFDIKIWNGTDMADLYYEANNNIAYGDIKVSTK